MWVGTGGEQGRPSSAARSKFNHEGEGCRNEHQLPQWVPGELEARSPSLVEVEVAAALGWGWGWGVGERWPWILSRAVSCWSAQNHDPARCREQKTTRPHLLEVNLPWMAPTPQIPATTPVSVPRISPDLGGRVFLGVPL